ncbi:MAG: ribosomal protein S18-alanine N-acetyltransferase [Clostridiales bacterium]|nr:ribosomal protein S18-alanine N-acetyltransferase [Clostridiales bacterium]
MNKSFKMIIPQKEHIHGIYEIEKLCFEHPQSEQSLLNDLNGNSVFFCCVCENGKVVGYINADTVLDEVYVINVCVHPHYRRQGIGERLVKALRDYCRDNSFAFVTLEVRQSNTAAISLYRKLGFEKAGLRKNFYTHPTEDADIMTLYFKR